MINKLIDTEKQIVILGFGREGQSTYRYLRQEFPDRHFIIRDKKPETEWEEVARQQVVKDKNVILLTGEEYLQGLSTGDLIFKTPGISHKNPEIAQAKKAGIEITSQTKLFFKLINGQVIGITGTKGKSTTASLIHHILETAEIKAILMGNIGKPAFDYLPDDSADTTFVYELSSHQLMDIDTSPHISVLLNIFREHLDYYTNFDEYIKAKANIAAFQTPEDTFIYNQDVSDFTDIAQQSKANKKTFSLTQKGDAYLFEDKLYLNVQTSDEILMPVSELTLLGTHNLYNILAASLAAYTAGAPVDNIRKGIMTFKPLAYRLEEVGTIRGITFIADTLATIPEATIAALNSFEKKVATLICGGFDRGQEFDLLAQTIVKKGVKTLLLFPTTGTRIWKEVEKFDHENSVGHHFVNSMEDAVRIAYEVTPKNAICLLSAASPSFSVFKNYEDETNKYKEAIANLV